MPHKDPAAARECRRRWRSKNSEHVKKYSREYAREWRKNNPERASANSERSRIKAVYGLTDEMYQEKLSNQEGLCAICRRVPANKNGFYIDHCHDTGKVRGLLCHHCNALIGMAGDSTATLQNAIAYLQYHGEGWD